MGSLLPSLDALLTAVREAAAQAGPEVARAAVFDADGTLWRGDIGDAAFEAAAAADMIDRATWDGPVRDWAARWDLELPDEIEAGVARIFRAARGPELADAGVRHGRAEGAWREELYAMQAWVYAGRARSAVQDFGERLFHEGFADGIFTDMHALLRALDALGIEVWIASASHGALVAAGAPRLDVQLARALGMEPALDDEGRTLPRIARGTYGPAKAEAARTALGGRRPLAACGDSVLTTDRELLETAVLPVAVAPRGAHREAALAHTRMHLFDPRR